VAGALAIFIWVAILLIVPFCTKGCRKSQSPDQQMIESEPLSPQRRNSTLIKVRVAEPTPAPLQATVSTVMGFKSARDEDKRRALGGVLTAGAQGVWLLCLAKLILPMRLLESSASQL
jgi:hypothetical protein